MAHGFMCWKLWANNLIESMQKEKRYKMEIIALEKIQVKI